MQEIYYEMVVKRTPVKHAKEIRIGLVIATLGSCICGFILNWLFFCIAIIFGAMFYYVLCNFEIEFEYSHQNEELVIDKVIANSYRKHMITVDLNKVLILTKIGDAELHPYHDYKQVDYSAKDPLQIPYVMIIMNDNQIKKLLLQLNPQMLDGLNKKIVRKI